ncbi:MAG: cyclomaltodextrinase N-terminal domain-containing protein [Rikenellaceae bacterium]|nr:cyclomaltodextrinase N-terminal domain-containing protein [Rikenellaceae bacterium]
MKEIPNYELNIERIEPPCWWTGMVTPLQLMIYGENVGSYALESVNSNVTIGEIYPADSPNYLFADIEISPAAEAGLYEFILKKDGRSISFKYEILERSEKSALRKSYDSSDVIYLIMPDRFARGANNQEVPTDIAEAEDRTDALGRHGGNLQGIIDHLNYLEQLGVTTLWITPFQLDNEHKASYHGYACADYYQTDPRYGNNELYRQLVEKAHKKGLKVIMDVVLNHCGMAHWWMKDLPFKNWVHIRQKDITSTYRLVSIIDPNLSSEDMKRTIDGWFDKNMPDIGLEYPFVLQYFIQVYVWWMEWAGLDGLRVDTFPYNDKYAAAKWTKALKEEYPNINIVAECWHSSPAIVSYWDGKKVNPDGYCSNLPSIMDFPLQEAINAGLKDPRSEWDAGMNLIYEAVAHDFLYTDPRSLMIFLDNHDIPRFDDNVEGNIGKIKAGFTMLATMRGIPQIYYGTEFGFRSNNLAAGDSGHRIDFPGGWNDDKKDFFAGKGLSPEERDIYEHARKLFNWRRNSEAVHYGNTMHFLPDGATYCYFRYTADNSVMIFINASEKPVAIDWERFVERTRGYRKGIDIISGNQIEIGVEYVVEPRTNMVIEFQNTGQ